MLASTAGDAQLARMQHVHDDAIAPCRRCSSRSGGPAPHRGRAATARCRRSSPSRWSLLTGYSGRRAGGTGDAAPATGGSRRTGPDSCDITTLEHCSLPLSGDLAIGCDTDGLDALEDPPVPGPDFRPDHRPAELVRPSPNRLRRSRSWINSISDSARCPRRARCHQPCRGQPPASPPHTRSGVETTSLAGAHGVGQGARNDLVADSGMASRRCRPPSATFRARTGSRSGRRRGPASATPRSSARLHQLRPVGLSLTPQQLRMGRAQDHVVGRRTRLG